MLLCTCQCGAVRYGCFWQQKAGRQAVRHARAPPAWNPRVVCAPAWSRACFLTLAGVPVWQAWIAMTVRSSLRVRAAAQFLSAAFEVEQASSTQGGGPVWQGQCGACESTARNHPVSSAGGGLWLTTGHLVSAPDCGFSRSMQPIAFIRRPINPARQCTLPSTKNALNRGAFFCGVWLLDQ
jgi:hypothetical protein